MIPRNVRGFLDRALAARRVEEDDDKPDRVIVSNDGRYVDAIVDGESVCIGGTSPRNRARVEIGMPVQVLDLPSRLAALATELEEQAALSRPAAPKDSAAWLQVGGSAVEASSSQHGYCDGLMEAATRLRRLLGDTKTSVGGARVGAPPTEPAISDGTGPQEVWLPPIQDALTFDMNRRCPWCGSAAHHVRTGRCGDCGRRPGGRDPADDALIGDHLGRGWREAQGTRCSEKLELSAGGVPAVCSRHLGHDGQHVWCTTSGTVIRTRRAAPLLDPAEQAAIEHPAAQPAATWTPERGWRGPLVEDTCKVGDPDPCRGGSLDQLICGEFHDFAGLAYACVRDPGHHGQHVAGNGRKVIAVWPQDGES